MPDNLKALLVDDWEYITKNLQVVPLPAKVPVNKILEMYMEDEKAKRTSPAEVDVLEEIVAGIREYFDKSLGRLLLYRFEREQYHILRKKWENGVEGYVDKGPCDIYGAEHLARLFGKISFGVSMSSENRPNLCLIRVQFRVPPLTPHISSSFAA